MPYSRATPYRRQSILSRVRRLGWTTGAIEFFAAKQLAHAAIDMPDLRDNCVELSGAERYQCGLFFGLGHLEGIAALVEVGFML